MRMVFILVLLVGLGLAGFAVHMAQNYIGQYQQALAVERQARENMVKTVDVFVVNRPMKYGDRLTMEDIRAVKWPEDAIPEGAFRTQEEIFVKGDQILRTVLRQMDKDEALLAGKVTEPGEDAGLTSRLPRGMRAFAIKVDVASGVSGFVRPGDRVDVYWTGRVSGQEGDSLYGEVTKLIDTAVNIIAVDQTANDVGVEANIARTVTVAATPQQVASLAQAQSTGSLSLALVGTEDDTVAEVIEVDQNRLLGIVRAEQQAAIEEKQVCTIRTRRGAEVVELPIPCTN